MKRFFLAALAALALSGCASIFSGTTQEVSIRSTPGARYAVTNDLGQRVTGGTVGDDATARMELARGAGYFSPHSYRVALSKPGYRPASVAVEPVVNPWYFANLAIGGFLGMVIVDPLTGAMFRLVPTADEVTLVASGDNPALAEAEAATIEKSRTWPVSRHDYTARQQARSAQCEPVGNAEVGGINTGREELRFACRDGRSVTVVCRSGQGCAGI